MPGIYVYADKVEEAADLIGLAAQSGKEVCCITLDSNQANELKQYGPSRIIILNGNSPLPENYAKSIAELIKNEEGELFLLASTVRGRELAAKTAGYLDCGMVSDTESLVFEDEGIISSRLIYGGSVVQKEIIRQLAVVTVPAGNLEAVKKENAQVSVVSLEVQADPRVRLIETLAVKKDKIDLAAAEKVVCVGMGLDKQEDIKMAEELAQVLGAQIACTRGIAEERQWLPVESYIGISGAKIKPSLYISMGVSGQVQHVVGIRDSKIIAAVDSNEKAPIVRAADYSIIGDMYEIIPLLIEELKKA